MTKKCLPPLILSAFFLLGWFLLTDSVTAQSHIFHLAVGEAQVLTLKGITRIAISNPDVLELVVTGKHEFLLNAKKRDVFGSMFGPEKARLSFDLQSKKIIPSLKWNSQN